MDKIKTVLLGNHDEIWKACDFVKTSRVGKAMLILEDKDMEVTEGRQRADLLLTPSFPVLSQLVSRDKTSAKLRPIASVPRHAATRIKPAKADSQTR